MKYSERKEQSETTEK